MNPVLVDLGLFQIRWYSIFIFLGALFGGFLVIKEGKRFKIPDDFFVNLIFWLIPVSLIGARLYYVLFNFEYYANNWISIFKVWEGGLAIHGGLLFGLLFTLIYCKKYRMNFSLVSDISVVGLILAQIVGRWGNFFNQEAFGPVVKKEFLESIYLPQFIIDGMYINGQYYHPTFLYEGVWNFIGLIILLIFRRTSYVKKGQLTAFYLIWYSFGRFFIEILRTDSLMLGSFKVAQLVSGLLFAIGLILFISFNKGSRFDNRYEDSEGSNNGTSETIY